MVIVIKLINFNLLVGLLEILSKLWKLKLFFCSNKNNFKSSVNKKKKVTEFSSD